MGLCHSKRGCNSGLATFPYRHVLITGASSGIGAAVAIKLAGLPGMTLTLIARKPERLRTVVEACQARGATVHGMLVDVCNQAAMEAAIHQANKLCPLDLVIANAGIVAQPEHQGQLPDMMWNAAHTNIMGTLNTITPALKLLKAHAATGNPAAVAVMSSVSALPANTVPFTGQLQLGMLPYAWSKQSLLMLGQGLEGELAGSGVQVFTICPGVVLTELATSWTQLFMSTNSNPTDRKTPATSSSTAELNPTTIASGPAALTPQGVGSSVLISVKADGDSSSRHSSELSTQGLGNSGSVVLPLHATVHLVDRPTPADNLKAGKPEVDSTTHSASKQLSHSHTAKSAAVAAGKGVSATSAATAEQELKKRLGAITPEEAAAAICQGLAAGKGGLIAFPAQAVRTMKMMDRLPTKFLLRAIKKGMNDYTG